MRQAACVGTNVHSHAIACSCARRPMPRLIRSCCDCSSCSRRRQRRAARQRRRRRARRQRPHCEPLQHCRHSRAHSARRLCVLGRNHRRIPTSRRLALIFSSNAKCSDVSMDVSEINRSCLCFFFFVSILCVRFDLLCRQLQNRVVRKLTRLQSATRSNCCFARSTMLS